jgi:hypothetical protein
MYPPLESGYMNQLPYVMFPARPKRRIFKRKSDPVRLTIIMFALCAILALLLMANILIAHNTIACINAGRVPMEFKF